VNLIKKKVGSHENFLLFIFFKKKKRIFNDFGFFSPFKRRFSFISIYLLIYLFKIVFRKRKKNIFNPPSKCFILYASGSEKLVGFSVNILEMNGVNTE